MRGVVAVRKHRAIPLLSLITVTYVDVCSCVNDACERMLSVFLVSTKLQGIAYLGLKS